VTYDFVYVDEEGFKKYKLKSFADLLADFQEYTEKTLQGAPPAGNSATLHSRR